MEKQNICPLKVKYVYKKMCSINSNKCGRNKSGTSKAETIIWIIKIRTVRKIRTYKLLDRIRIDKTRRECNQKTMWLGRENEDAISVTYRAIEQYYTGKMGEEGSTKQEKTDKEIFNTMTSAGYHH